MEFCIEKRGTLPFCVEWFYIHKDISARCLDPFPGMNYTCNKNIPSYASNTEAVTLPLIPLCFLNINTIN
jgi:hypothetical protein